MHEPQSEQSSEFRRIFSHTKAKCGDLNLHYVIGGDGDPLLLLHGFPESWHMWRKVMLPLAKKYTLIVSDQRGSGSSDYSARYPGVEVTAIEGSATEVVRRVDDGSIDIGILEARRIDEAWKSIRIGSDEMVLAVGRKHHLAEKKSVKPADLDDCRWSY